MSRYHTLDSYTGEIVHQSNQHPQARISRPQRRYAQRRYTGRQILIFAGWALLAIMVLR